MASTTTKRPPAPPPPPTAPPPAKSPTSSIPEAVEFGVSRGGDSPMGARIVIYGTGGIGKTTLAGALPEPLFIDLENGVQRLGLDVMSTTDVGTWQRLREALAWIEVNHAKLKLKSLVIDSVSAAQDMCVEHIVTHRKTEKGRSVESIEGFGWGKGWQFVYDEFVALLADLERIAAQGIHVCLVAHNVSSVVPNPQGEDFLRWEPFLASGDKKGRGDVRSRVKNWADHMLFLSYDIFAKDGKATGGGSRSIYTTERPTYLAKTRSDAPDQQFELENLSTFWSQFGI